MTFTDNFKKLLSNRALADVEVLIEYIDALQKEEQFTTLKQWVDYFQEKLAEFLTNCDEEICTKIALECRPDLKPRQTLPKRVASDSREEPSKKQRRDETDRNSKRVPQNDQEQRKENYFPRQKEPHEKQVDESISRDSKHSNEKFARSERSRGSDRIRNTDRRERGSERPRTPYDRKSNDRDSGNARNSPYQKTQEEFSPEDPNAFDYRKFKECSKNKAGHFVFSVLDVDIKQVEAEKKTLIEKIYLAIDESKDEKLVDDLKSALKSVSGLSIQEFKEVSDEMELNSMSVSLKLTPLVEKWLNGGNYTVGYPQSLEVFHGIDLLKDNLEFYNEVQTIAKNEDLMSLTPDSFENIAKTYQEFLLPSCNMLSPRELVNLFALFHFANGESLKSEIYGSYLNERIFWISGFAQHVKDKVETYFGNFPHDFDASIHLSSGSSSLSVQTIGNQSKELSAAMELKLKEKKMVPGVGFVQLKRHVFKNK
eukprot:NODE_10_length_61504_cov_0.956502.p11 type:complete len:483 gc:universal NODE_10_length_61504_cov_0.956502:43071-41623(-)